MLLKPSAETRSPLFSQRLGDHSTAFRARISPGFQLGPCHPVSLLILTKGTRCESGSVEARRRQILHPAPHPHPGPRRGTWGLVSHQQWLSQGYF